MHIGLDSFCLLSSVPLLPYGGSHPSLCTTEYLLQPLLFSVTFGRQRDKHYAANRSKTLPILHKTELHYSAGKRACTIIRFM